MNFHYENWLMNQLLALQAELELTDYDIVAEEEQQFLNHELKANTIYVVIKYLASSLQTGAKVQPVQIMILSEQNGLDKVKILFNEFATRYNWSVSQGFDEYVKHQYATPIVLSNFNEASYGYRSVLYMSGTLFIMDNVIDIKELYIDTQKITPISFNIVYSMSTNTQQKPSDYIAKSEKTVSTFSVSLTVPLTSSPLANKVLGIIDEDNTGNEDFAFVITLSNNTDITKSLKLTGAHIITAVNQVPALELTFMR